MLDDRRAAASVPQDLRGGSTVKRKAFCIAALATVAAANFVGIAAGGTAPRLQGSFRVKVKITASTGIRNEHKGETGKEKFSFRSRCKTGPCATVLSRRGLDGRTDTPVVLKPAGSLYKGSLKGSVSCTASNGVDALVKEMVTLKPTQADGGKVTAFSGSVVTRYALTKLGHAQHCPKTGQTLVFHSS
jgi:hypothetical protein